MLAFGLDILAIIFGQKIYIQDFQLTEKWSKIIIYFIHRKVYAKALVRRCNTRKEVEIIGDN
jgi:hypothetical protein